MNRFIAFLVSICILIIACSACNNGSTTPSASSNSSPPVPPEPIIDDSITLLPYVQLNVDEVDRFNWYKGVPSVDTNQAITSFTDYFPTDYSGDTESQFTLTGSPALTAYFVFDKYGNLDVASPLSKNSFESLIQDPTCSMLDNDPNKYYCKLEAVAASEVAPGYSKIGALPIILYAGLRKYNIAEMTRNLTGNLSTTGGSSGTWDNVPMRPNPFDYDNGVFLPAGTVEPSTGQYPVYYMEISAVPGDFTSLPVSIVNLQQYFYSPDGLETFSFDASPLVSDGSATTCNIVLLTGVNSFSSPHTPQCLNTTPANTYFSITNSGVLTATKQLLPGIYQINIKASELSGSTTEVAYQTFYINVATGNPSLAQWKHGYVASSNILKNFNSIYTYPAGDPVTSYESSGFQSSYEIYGEDLSTINNMMPLHPIKTTFSEIISEQYAYSSQVESAYKISFWKLVQNANPESQITPSGITNNRESQWPAFTAAVKSVVDPSTGSLGKIGVGLTLNFDFDNNPRADFSYYNSQQQTYLARSLVNAVLTLSEPSPTGTGSIIDGLAMDLEAGQPSISGSEAFKAIADRLAYNGRWMAFYEFAGAFSPYNIAAFGPLGVAAFSTYDAASQRAPKTTADEQPYEAELPYSLTFSTNQYEALYAAFIQVANSESTGSTCSQWKNGPAPIPLTVSWCGETINDAVSANSQQFNSNNKGDAGQYTISDAFIALNGKYIPILPTAATSTLWNKVELWQPDMTKLTAYVMTDGDKCRHPEAITNAFFAQNESALNNPASLQYQELASCLLNDVLLESGIPVQTFEHCGESTSGAIIPYATCILISNLPGAVTSGANNLFQPPTQSAYVAAILPIYSSTIAHSPGYSFFALETPATNNPLIASSAESPPANGSVQEPWYSGFNYPNESPEDPYYNPTANLQQWESTAAIINAYYN